MAWYLSDYLLSVTCTFRSNTGLKMADDKGIKALVCSYVAGEMSNIDCLYHDNTELVELRLARVDNGSHISSYFSCDEWLAFANQMDSITRIVSDAGREAISR